MTQFKEGQTIIMKEDCSGAIKGKKYILRYGSKLKDFKCNLYAWDKETDGCGCSCQEKWQLAEKTLYDLEVGDEVIDYNGNEVSILGKLGDDKNLVYVYSCTSDRVNINFLATAKAMERDGWKVKQLTPEVPEYTKEEQEAMELLKKNGFSITKK